MPMGRFTIFAAGLLLALVAGTASAGDYRHRYHDDGGYDAYRQLQLGAGIGVSRHTGYRDYGYRQAYRHHAYRHHAYAGHDNSHDRRLSRTGVHIGVGIGITRRRDIGHRRVEPHYVDRSVRRHYVRQQHVRDPYADRTRFCRHEYRYKGHRKVKVKRCIYVRNDLLGVYAGDGWVRH